MFVRCTKLQGAAYENGEPISWYEAEIIININLIKFYEYNEKYNQTKIFYVNYTIIVKGNLDKVIKLIAPCYTIL